MLSYTFFKALTFPVTYLLVAVLVLTAILQIKYLNRALSRFNATQVIPTQFVLFTLSVILGSAVLYRDFERTSAEQAGKFAAGCALTFAGVWLITSSRDREGDEEEGFEEDEDAILLEAEQAYRDMAENATISRRSSTRPNASSVGLPNGRPQSTRYTSGSITFPALSTSTTSPDMSGPIAVPETQQPASVPPSIPSTYTEASSISEHALPESGQQTPRNRLSIQRILQPLAAIFPQHNPEPQLAANVEAMNSTPVLPSEARLQPSRPETPRVASDHDHLTTPVTPHTADAAHLLSRQSLSALVPGPLSAPLSNSLSAIVAESLRRGVDVDSLRRRRRRPKLKLPGMPWKTGLRQRATSEADAALVAGDGAEDDLRDLYAQSPSRAKGRTRESDGQGSGGGEEGQGGRGRSLSATLGDLLRRKRRKVDREEQQHGEEDGVAVASEPVTPADGPAGSSS